MVSTKVYQNMIQQMNNCTDRVVGVIDESASVIACNDLAMIGERMADNLSDLVATSDTRVAGGYTFRVVGPRTRLENAVFVKGSDAVAEMMSGVLSASLASLRDVLEEKNNKANFIKNVMLENILPGDVYAKSKELRFNNDAARAVILIRLIDRTELFAFDIIQSLFPEQNKDFVINIGEHDIVLVKEVRPNVLQKDLEKLARSIVDTLNSEFFTRSVVGIGSIVTNLREIARSYKEAQVAIEVAKVFDVEKTIVSYNNLGIGRLIYYLPTSLCRSYMAEVFKKGSVEALDQETLFTIQKFFENNLNVSETSRKLFVHRNTLVYRLDKIRRLTGLDLRQFDQAIVFKVALMVRKYLETNPKQL